ncbi:hypothetical protein ACN9ML_05605 [Dyadobacter endophyticus]|uniref:hypothetical protein n=1 Tax=Dyadobacter TaxID=120831 RepID=UPI003CEB2DF6
MKLSQQIANKVYPIMEGNRHLSSERLNLALVQELEALTAKPIDLLTKLLECSVPNSGNKHIFDEVRRYLDSLR